MVVHIITGTGRHPHRWRLVLHRQKAPIWVRVSFIILGALAILAAFLTVPWAN